MSTTTPNLGLKKPNVTDKVNVSDLNGNADLLDAIIGRLSNLNTTQKGSLVAAINEALTSAGTAAGFGNPVATVDGNTGTPSVEVTASGPDTAKVFTFTFKNLKGAKGAPGDPGAKGDPGRAGSDGISPVVSVETISGGHRITITDAGGSQSFDVLDGASGSGSGDMTKAVYDPKGKAQDIFSYADNKYSKPSGGIPKKDLASDVQASLCKADSALQNAPVPSVTSKTGAVSITKGDVGLGNVDNVKQYSASNPPPYPVTSVNGKTGAVTMSVPTIPSTTSLIKGDGSGGVSAAVKGTDYFTPTDVDEIAAEAAKKVDVSSITNKVSKSGDTMTGKLTVPQVETGNGDSNFFQCRKFRGEGNADTYYHAIDFGYSNHDSVDFHEYGGIWSFYKNQTGKAKDGVLCGKITINGWEGRAKLESGSTMVTSQLTENSNAIATTAFFHGLVDGLKSKGVSVTLPASGWNANAKTQTVSVAGVTATANCIITAAPDSYMADAKAGVRCTAQGAGTLAFACETVPTANVAANVLILG